MARLGSLTLKLQRQKSLILESGPQTAEISGGGQNDCNLFHLLMLIKLALLISKAFKDITEGSV